jgi:hypothetical protein
MNCFGRQVNNRNENYRHLSSMGHQKTVIVRIRRIEVNERQFVRYINSQFVYLGITRNEWPKHTINWCPNV